MELSYTPLAERPRVSGGYAHLMLPVSYAFISVCAAFPPSAARSVLSLCALNAGALVLYNVAFDAPFVEAYAAISCWGGMYVMWFDRILCASPDRERWHRMRRPSSNSSSSSSSSSRSDTKAAADGEVFQPPHGFWARLRWIWSQTIAIRGFGMSWQVKNVPPAPAAGTRRWAFVGGQLLRFVFYMMLADLTKIYAANTPLSGYRYWDDDDHHDDHQHHSGRPAAAPQFFALSSRERFVAPWLLIAQAYYSLSFITALVYAVGVAAGAWRPEQCPRPFGDLRRLHTVRGAWSVVWHQLMRRMAVFPGRLVAKRWLRLRPGSFASKYVQLAVGFATTGFTHSVASVLMYGCDGGEMAFWMLQVAAIMVEDHVVEYGRRLGLKDGALWRTVGFVWTVVWFGVSSQQYMGRNVEKGQLVSRRPPDPFGLDAWLRQRR